MLRKLTTISLLSLLATSSLAYAAGGDESAYGGPTIGGTLSRIISDSWNPVFILVVVLMAVTGIYFIARGLVKCVEAAQNNGRSGFGSAIAYLFAGAMLVALPDVAGIGMTSMFNYARGGGTLHSAELDYNDQGMDGSFLGSIAGNLVNPGGVRSCVGEGVEAPATCIASNLSSNVVPMGIYAIFAIVFIVGLITFALAIIELAKATERGDQSKGKFTKLITSILLMNAPMFYTVISTTMLGSIDNPITVDGYQSGSELLKYPMNSNIQVVKNFSELIGHAFRILAFFGAWAFVRGIFMIKGVAEGRQQGSYGMAMTYMIAGILMANSKFSACIILGTFGGSGMSAGFC